MAKCRQGRGSACGSLDACTLLMSNLPGAVKRTLRQRMARQQRRMKVLALAAFGPGIRQ
jgi:hypothetical protein